LTKSRTGFSRWEKALASAEDQRSLHIAKNVKTKALRDKLEEAAWAIGIPAISAGVYWFSIRIGIISPVWTLGSLPAW